VDNVAKDLAQMDSARSTQEPLLISEL
jgi:hypothetical protein